MDIFKFSEKLMSMDDTVWMRHANPWSVFTRFSCLPLIVLAIWSRAWIGWWSLIPIAAALIWTWLNPRLFPKPKNFDHWASRGVLGERIFLARNVTPITAEHKTMAYILTVASVAGAIILIYGVVMLDFWATAAGLLGTILPKLWFVDRMVWLYDDTQRAAETKR